MMILFLMAFFAVVLSPAIVYVTVDARAAHAADQSFWTWDGGEVS